MDGICRHFCVPTTSVLLPYSVGLIFAAAVNQAVCRLEPTTQGHDNPIFQTHLLKLRQQVSRHADGK